MASGSESHKRMIDTGTDTVRVEVSERVGVITLNRPDRRNALHRDMYPAIKAALADFASADDVGCVVLTGEGKGFCAGGDVRDPRPKNPDGSKMTPEQRMAMLADDGGTALAFHECAKVTIAALNGAAVGAGMSLALSCDLRIACVSARLIGGWSRLGFSGDFGGAWLLTRLVGPSRALEVLASNATVTMDDAARWGLVNRVVADEVFEEEWRAWARVFAHGPQAAIAGMKQNVRDAAVLSMREALPPEASRMVGTSLTADHKEAVRAWLDGREPVFGAGSRQ